MDELHVMDQELDALAAQQRQSGTRPLPATFLIEAVHDEASDAINCVTHFHWHAADSFHPQGVISRSR